MQNSKKKPKDCPKCRTVCEQLRQEHSLLVEPELLPDLCKDLLEESEVLQKTVQALRQTNSHIDAHLRKENAMLMFEIEEAKRLLQEKEAELANIKAK